VLHKAFAQFDNATVAVIVAGLAVAALACSSTGLAASPTSRPASHEITVNGRNWAQGVTVSLHDILIVAPPARYDEWRVHPSSDDIVRVVNSDRARRPGAAGWRLEAVGRGRTTVTFVPFVPSGETSSASNEPRFTLRVTVQ
jgi:hypothetical protein